MQLPQKRKTFCWIFCCIFEIYIKFWTGSKKKMTVIAYVFPILQNPESMVRCLSKKSRFRGPFETQHGKRAQTLLQYEREHLHQIYWSLWRHLSREKSLLVICTILRLSVNTLTAHDKYSPVDRDNLMQPIHMHWSQK